MLGGGGGVVDEHRSLAPGPGKGADLPSRRLALEAGGAEGGDHLVGSLEAIDAHAIVLLPQQHGGEPQLGEPPHHGIEDRVPGGLALDACAQAGEPLEPLQVAGARRHVHELEQQLLGTERCDVQLEGNGAAARRHHRDLVERRLVLAEQASLAPEEQPPPLSLRQEGVVGLPHQHLGGEADQRADRAVDVGDRPAAHEHGRHRKRVEERGRVHDPLPSPRSTRFSPTRSVTFSRSKYSASGMTCFRVAPTSSLKAWVSISLWARRCSTSRRAKPGHGGAVEPDLRGDAHRGAVLGEELQHRGDVRRGGAGEGGEVDDARGSERPLPQDLGDPVLQRAALATRGGDVAVQPHQVPFEHQLPLLGQLGHETLEEARIGDGRQAAAQLLAPHAGGERLGGVELLERREQPLPELDGDRPGDPAAPVPVEEERLPAGAEPVERGLDRAGREGRPSHQRVGPETGRPGHLEHHGEPRVGVATGEDPELRGVLRPSPPPLARKDGEDAPTSHRLAAPLDGPEPAQDEALAGERRHRGGEAQLRERRAPRGKLGPAVDQGDRAGDLGRAHVEEQAGPVADGAGRSLEERDLHVEDGARRHHAGVGERLSAGDRPGLHAREVHGGALAGRGARRRLPVDLHGACAQLAHRRGGRHEDQRIPLRDRPGEDGPGDHGAEPLQREGPVHREEQRAVGRALGDLGGQRVHDLHEPWEPLPGAGRDRDDGGRLQEGAGAGGADLLLQQRQPVGSQAGEQVALRHHHGAARDPEQPADVEVLAGLGHDPLVGRHHQQHEIDAARARRHGPDEALVAGHVDDARHRPAGERQVGEAELDGDPAPLLLGQPVGVDAGEGPDQRCLAVVDVPCGADDDALHSVLPVKPPRSPGRRAARSRRAGSPRGRR